MATSQEFIDLIATCDLSCYKSCGGIRQHPSEKMGGCVVTRMQRGESLRGGPDSATAILHGLMSQISGKIGKPELGGSWGEGTVRHGDPTVLLQVPFLALLFLWL